MYRGDRKLARRIKRRVREAVRASESLRRQAKRGSRGGVRSRPTWMGVLVLNAFAFGMLASRAANPLGPGQIHALSMLTLFEFCAACVIAGWWQHQMQDSWELRVWAHYPIPGSTVAADVWWRTMRVGIPTLLVLAAVYLIHNHQQPAPLPLGAVLAVAAAQWLLTLAAAIVFGAKCPRQRLALASFGLFGLMVLFTFWPQVARGLADVQDVLMACAVPIGTLNFLVALGLPVGVVTAAAGVAAVAACVMLWQSYRRIVPNYEIPQSELVCSPEAALADALETAVAEEITDDPYLGHVPELESAARREVRQRLDEHMEEVARVALRDRRRQQEAFWQSLDAVGRWIGRWLTPRERVVAELLTARQPGCLPSFRGVLRTAVAFVAGIGLSVLIVAVWPSWSVGVFIAWALVAYALLTSVVWPSWPGLLAYPMRPQYTRVYAPYPVGYRELSRVLMKIGLVRLVLWSPFLAAIAAAGAFVLCFFCSTGPVERLPISFGVVAGIKFVLALGAMLPGFVALRLSPMSSTDWWTVGGLVAGAVRLLPFAVAGLAGLGMACVPNGPVAALGLGVVAVSSSGYWRCYQRRYERGRVDMVFRRSEAVG